MRILILGAGGLIGVHLARQILAAPGAVQSLVLADAAALPVPAAASIPVRCEQGDICDDAFMARLLADTDCVFHFAALLAHAAEADYDRGMAVNLTALMRLLDLCGARPTPPRLVFTSSIASFGGPLPTVVDDGVAHTPQSTYGTQKAIAELLIDNCSRLGMVDGRILRLPIVLMRNGPPSLVVSDRVAALIREPLHGRDVVCGLRPDTRMTVGSAARVAAALRQMSEFPADVFGHTRAMNLPALSVTPAELEAAVGRSGVRHIGRITWQPDAALQSLVDSWPQRFESGRAASLGLAVEGSADELVRRFVAEAGLT